MCFKSKNLYNYANYFKRQAFINGEKIPSAFDLNKELKTHEPFKALPAKTAQQVIIKLDKNWKSYYKGLKEYKKNNSNFCGMPKIPKYKDKNGKFICEFDYMQIIIKYNKAYFQGLKSEKLKLKDKLFIETKVNERDFKLLQIIPYGNCYKISLVYEANEVNLKEDNNNYMAIDLGLNNLATCVNNLGLKPIIINGKILKSENQYYNKEISKARENANGKSTNKIKKLSFKRNNIVDTHMHRISRYIVNYCIENNINTIIIGENKDFKRNINIGNKNNQNFVYIPHKKIIDMITYKSADVGINVKLTEESYTSKASFIDNDILPTKFGDYEFSGKRIRRGLYQSKDGVLINADVNGAYNILRKCNQGFKYDLIQDLSLNPIIINI